MSPFGSNGYAYLATLKAWHATCNYPIMNNTKLNNVCKTVLAVAFLVAVFYSATLAAVIAAPAMYVLIPEA